MKYLLDTNVCIHFLRGKYGLIETFQEIGTENVAISEISLAELVFGAENSTNSKKNLELIEVFTNQVGVGEVASPTGWFTFQSPPSLFFKNSGISSQPS
ncbi:PIN domain-containing protein [Cyclobacterium roseum]|uniref:PIN domain-containing protein n=1 Tax=Cyclobacterium roseum TaxID=2666137 RepID=UPI001391F71F|nr:PIN domain-containing protein [Cyclobacterium roseum]